MHVLILNDRAHKNVGALALLKSCCEEIAPPHEILWANLHELNMQPCKRCKRCHPCGECILPEDDAHRIGRLIFSADALVIGLNSSLKNLSATCRILLDRCTSSMVFHNQQGKASPWRKGRPAVIVSLENTESLTPAAKQTTNIAPNPLLRALELGAFKILGNLATPLKNAPSPSLPLISQARSIGSRLSCLLTCE